MVQKPQNCGNRQTGFLVNCWLTESLPLPPEFSVVQKIVKISLYKVTLEHLELFCFDVVGCFPGCEDYTLLDS